MKEEDKIKVFIFVRIKRNEHCINVLHRSKIIKIIWDNGAEQALLIVEKWKYEVERNWLIKHPFLSCFTEIQLIILKNTEPTQVPSHCEC